MRTVLIASGCCRVTDLPEAMAAAVERVRKTPLWLRGGDEDEEGAATPGEIIP